MLRCFIVPNGTKLYDDFTRYEESAKQIHHAIHDWCIVNGIETDQYSAGSEIISIKETQEHREKFGMQIKKQALDGMISFKKNSPLYKSWVNICKKNEVLFAPKPFMPNYFSGHGRMNFKIFRCEDIIYCDFKAESEFEPYEKYTEIKASEYYKVIEESKGKNNFT